MKKLLSVLTTILLVFGGTSTTAFAYANTATWNGNGGSFGNGNWSADNQQCDGSGNYLFWVLTANGATAADIDFDGPGGNAPAAMSRQSNGSFRYTQSLGIPPAGTGQATATYAGSASRNAKLVISHGCTANPRPELTVTKSETSSGIDSEGDVITYSITARNTGTVTLHNVNITDGNATIGSCSPAVPVSSLAVGSSITCSATHTVTAADMTAGEVRNIASGTSDEDSDDSNEVVTDLTANPSLTVSKSRTGNAPSAEGDVISYSITATNSGNVVLHNVNISDPNADSGSLDCDTELPATLALGASISCTAEHTVTAADMNAGSVTNVAYGTSDEANDSDDDVTPLTPTPELSVEKSRTGNAPSAEGDVISYSITATNSGNVVLHNVNISDPNADSGSLDCDTTLPATLALGASISCTAEHTVTAADMNAGSVTNVAYGTSNEDNDSDDDVTPLTPTPELTVSKTETSTGVDAEGDVITYSITLTNTGNVVLNNVNVSDPNADSGSLDCDTTLPATLALGASISCTAEHTVTAADMTAGSVTNTAYGTSNEDNDSDDAVTSLEAEPELTVSKSRTGIAPSAEGDVISYSITATNSGNVVLHNVNISDPNADSGSLDCDTELPATLALGATISCTATHTVTAADMNAGSVTNVAYGTSDEDNDSDEDVTSLTPTPELSVSKSETSTGINAEGDVITYSITLTNTGNVVLHNVNVSDPNADSGSLDCDTTRPATLALGASISCTAEHTVTAADMNAGSVTNTAYGTSDEDNGSDDAVTTLTANPELTVVKSQTGAQPTRAGDVINYSITVTNTGNINLTNVTLTDANATLGTCPAQDLAISESMTCTATHVVTQADVAAGEVVNVAVASTGSVTENSNEVVTTLPSAPGLNITKQVTGVLPTKAGDVINYLITVSNTGNVPLSDLRVTDANAVIGECSRSLPTVLGVGDSLTCNATHVVTDADMLALKVDNVAQASSGSLTKLSNLVTVPLTPTAALSIIKSLSGAPGSKVGEVINYTITVQNTGNITLEGVNVTDANAVLGECTVATPATLLSGASFSCAASHVITEADLIAGKVDNVASASVGELNVNSNIVTVPLVKVLGLSITKRQVGAAPQKVGDFINYTIVATNTGNVTLTGVVITDDNAVIVSCDKANPLPSMAPGETLTCSARHAVTVADTVAGRVINIAVVRANEDVSAQSGTEDTTGGGTGGTGAGGGTSGSNINSNQVTTLIKFSASGTKTTLKNPKIKSLAYTGGEVAMIEDHGELYWGFLALVVVGFVMRRRLVRS